MNEFERIEQFVQDRKVVDTYALVLHAPHPTLARKALPVRDFDSELADLCQKLAQMVEDDSGSVGLAAPQIGVSKRVFAMRTAEGTVQAVVNPRIVQYGGAAGWVNEGCFSLPGVTVRVQRWRRVSLRGYDQEGARISARLEDIYAQCAQHEIDHLDGILILERGVVIERKGGSGTE